MCGICGILNFDVEQPVEKSHIKSMLNMMIHRGPDDEGYYFDGNIGLGHRRLSIIDISKGHQPITNEDQTVWIVFNGEIYNYRDLAHTLKSKGHAFKTDSDTEVIAHAYEEYGAEVCCHLRGMFAFAIWDSKKKELFIARDRVGIKPLYYYRDNNVFLFGSEIKPMLEIGLIKSGISYDVIDSFLSIGYVPGEKTMFRNVNKLEPAHYIKINQDGFSKECYWQMNEIEINSDYSENEWKEITLSKLSECVKIRLMSEVPLGVFLSGGLDSSLIVALMKRLGCETIKTFSIGFENSPEANELEYARIVANHFKTEHYEFIMKPLDFMESIETVVKHTEEPIVEAPAIALYHLSKLAKKHVTVILSGEGADEVFGGYNIYSYFSKIDKIRSIFSLLGVAHFRKSLGKLVKKEKYIKYIDWIMAPLTESYRGISSNLVEGAKKEVYGEALIGANSNYLASFYQSRFKECEKYELIHKLLYMDTKGWLVDDLLLKADKMTMANSMELRVPFLDHEMIEMSYQIPSCYKVKKGQGKYILKKIAEDILPRDIIWRKKMGFTMPTARCFQDKKIVNIIKDKLYSGALVSDAIVRKKDSL